MPRIVRDQNVRSLEPTATPRDFYHRPAIGPESRLEKIASAYAGISTNLGQWLSQQRKKREDIEIAQGMELYRKRLGYGEQYDADQMQEKARQGDYEGYKDLTRWQKEGIRRMRHEIFGSKLQEHMLTWQRTATLPDENGNPIPLSMVQDSDRVMDAFFKESARYAQEKTGGQYDPRLAQEHIRTAERSALNQFINEQAKYRNQQIWLEQQAAATEMLDIALAPIINSGKLITDPVNGAAELGDAIGAVAVRLMNEGVSLNDAMTFSAQYVGATMRNTRDDATIDAIRDAALQHPLFENPALKAQIIANAEDGHQANYYRTRRENELKAEQAYRQAWDLQEKIRRGEATREEMQQFALAAPEHAEAVAQMVQAVRQGYDAAMAMQPEEYDNLRIQAMNNRLSYAAFRSLLPRLNDAQRDEIAGYLQYNETRLRRWQDEQEKLGKNGSRATYNKMYASERKKVEEAVNYLIKPELDIYEGGGAEQRANLERVRNVMYQETFYLFDKWCRNNPALASDPYEVAHALNDYADQITRRYMPNLDTYLATPERLEEDPYPVLLDESQKRLDALHKAVGNNEERQRAIDAALRNEDKVQMAKLLKRYGLAEKNNADNEAAKCIEASRVLMKEDARRAQMQKE